MCATWKIFFFKFRIYRTWRFAQPTPSKGLREATMIKNASVLFRGCFITVSIPEYSQPAASLRRVEKFKNLCRNIFRVGKYVNVLGGLKKVV